MKKFIVLACSTLLGVTGGNAVAVDVDLADQVVRFRGPVDQPDVMGGYASTHVVVKVAPGVEPAQLADGRTTLARIQRRNFDQNEALLAAMLDQVAVTEIVRSTPFEFANRELAAELGLDRFYTIRVPQGTNTRQLAEQLRTFEGLIEIAQVDGIGGVLQTFPNDPSFNVQYGLHNTGQTIEGQAGIAGAHINAAAAWDIHTGTADIIIAVVDTGIATGHPEFAGKLVTGYNPMSNNNSVGDSPLIPHGTHVSGIAAANSNNGMGISGVSWGARLMPIKALNLFGGGSEVDIANGVLWAVDNGAHVINMSIGVPEGIAMFEAACQYAFDSGLLLVAATGNTPGAAIGWPAIWPTVMAVGATDNRDQLSSFTTTGPAMSVTAPGTDVYSTYMGLFGNSTYAYQSGTSMASPHVAGLAALVWSAHPSLTNVQLWQLIESTADDLGTPGWNPQFGHGRINAYAALTGVQVLPNDSCADAIAVSDGLTNFSNVNATTSGPNEPAMCNIFGDTNIQADIWFEYEATCTGMMTVSLCDSAYVTKLGIYGANCPAGSGEILACDVNSCPSIIRAEISLAVTAGEVFKLRVGGHNDAQGSGMLSITCDPVQLCPADLDGSGTVDVSDLLLLFSAWGPCPGCAADLNGDNTVNVSDLLILLGAWGACP